MKYNSQASQDKFVLGILNHPTTGFYLEIGAGHPIEINNTYLMETLGWNGISIDNGQCAGVWKEKRKNRFINDNACTLDYKKILNESNAPKFIDYLSIDIDEASTIAMQQIPFGLFDFKVITIEHDAYRNGDRLRADQRKYLNSKGYIIVCENVCNTPENGNEFPFEDWYIHPTIYSKQPILKNKVHTDIIKIYGF